MVKKVGKYELGRSLGEGTFGKVKYAIDTETNEAVAIKILDKEKIQKQNMGNQIKKEISIMKMVKHKYIVGMIEVLASKTKIFIVLELVTGGELFDKIVQVGKLQEDQARFYFQQLVEGVEYCHKLGVCHRDLKPENLLLDEHGNLKISDFGLSSLYIGDAEGSDGTCRTELLHTTCGTPNYVAPEVLSDQGYDGKRADAWSIGVILYVLLAGFLPFDESTIVALFAKIQSADFTYPSWFTPEVRSLLDQMLVADPKVRITLAQIKLHPWFLGPAAAGGGFLNAPTAGSDTTTPLVHMPTDAQLEAAVQSLHIRGGSTEGGEPGSSLEGSNHGNGGCGNADHDDYDDYIHQGSEPVSLNAFELVSHCGGFMLDKMFSPEIFYSVEDDDHDNEAIVEGLNSARSTMSTKTGAAVAGGVGGAILFGESRSSATKTKCYHFTATAITPQELITAVIDALTSMGFDFENVARTSHSSNAANNHHRNSSSSGLRETMINSGVVKTSFLSAKGMVGMFIQAFHLSGGMSLLQIKKGKGDLLEWNNAFSELVDRRIAHLLNKPRGSTASGGGEGK